MALNLKKRGREADTTERKKPKLSRFPSESAGSSYSDAEDDIVVGQAKGSREPGDRSEDDDMADEEQDDTEPNTDPKFKKTKILDGLRDIQDAAELYQSSSFKLQIDALLPNVRPKLTPSRLAPLEHTLHALHALFKKLPSKPPKHPLDASREMQRKGIAVPYPSPLPSKDTNWKVSFEPPSDIALVGSWANQLSVKGKDGAGYGVDLAVEMPNELFQEKDYLNFRFFHKRAFYIATLADALANGKNEIDLNISYVSMADDPRLTVLELHPKKGSDTYDFSGIGAHIRIIPVLSPTSPIPLQRLSPSLSNIRNVSSSLADSPDQSSSDATPLYNNTLLSSIAPKRFIISALELKKSVPAFADALTLLRLWANQRGYGGGGSGLCVMGFETRGCLWGSLLGLLIHGEDPAMKTGKGLKRKALGSGLSSYQLFRGALDFLANHRFEKEPVFMKLDTEQLFQREDYVSHHPAVFVHSSATVNLLADVPLNSLELLQVDARKTLDELDHSSQSMDPFAETLLQDHRDLSSRFDAVLRIDLASAELSKVSLLSSLDHGSSATALMSLLNSIIRRGLGDRTKAAVILHPVSSARPLSQAHPSTHRFIHIGLLYNGENAFRVVEHGPSAEETDADAAKQFQEFWGVKSELRRFQDGRITHSVVWDVKTVDDRAQIPMTIVQYLLKLHFGIPDDACHVWQKNFNPLIRLPETISQIHTASSTPIGFAGARTAFDSLVKTIRGMDDLPLTLSTVSATSEYLRSTSVFAPTPMRSPTRFAPCARYQPFLHLVLEFEKSSKWPDDLAAIQKVKLAFLEHISSALMDSSEKFVTKVAVGEVFLQADIEDKARLEVITPEGWAFSLRIAHDRELTLLDRIINKKPTPAIQAAQLTDGSLTTASVHDAIAAKFTYLQRFIHGPRHHRAIASLNHRYPAYAGTVRLVKRWLTSHWLLHSHIMPEVIEIICASIFIRDGGNSDLLSRSPRIPQSKERGFAMIIQFFHDWKWEDGLNVDLYDDNVKSPSYPTPAIEGVWRVTTGYDKEGRIWTAQGPDAIVARRLKALAKVTWEHMLRAETGDLDVKSLFIHPTDDYDFVILLNKEILPRYAQSIAPDASLLAKRESKHRLEPQSAFRPDFDPARMFFDDLKRIYSDSILFFYDMLGGDRIGGVWNAKLKTPRPFRVLGGFSSTPVQASEKESKKGKVNVVLNDFAILGEIERMGNGIIKSITVQNNA